MHVHSTNMLVSPGYGEELSSNCHKLNARWKCSDFDQNNRTRSGMSLHQRALFQVLVLWPKVVSPHPTFLLPTHSLQPVSSWRGGKGVICRSFWMFGQNSHHGKTPRPLDWGDGRIAQTSHVTWKKKKKKLLTRFEISGCFFSKSLKLIRSTSNSSCVSFVSQLRMNRRLLLRRGVVSIRACESICGVATNSTCSSCAEICRLQTATGTIGNKMCWKCGLEWNRPSTFVSWLLHAELVSLQRSGSWRTASGRCTCSSTGARTTGRAASCSRATRSKPTWVPTWSGSTLEWVEANAGPVQCNVVQKGARNCQITWNARSSRTRGVKTAQIYQNYQPQKLC